MGFDFDNSPFGEDNFDYWPFDKTELEYKDYFDGYTFFLSIEKFKSVEGIPNLFKYNDFKNELIRRSQIYRESYNRDKPELSWYNHFDQIQIKQVYGITNSQKIVNQWLK